MSQEKKKHKNKTDGQPAEPRELPASSLEQPVSMEAEPTAEAPVADLTAQTQKDSNIPFSPAPGEDAASVSFSAEDEVQPEVEPKAALEQASGTEEQHFSSELPQDMLPAGPAISAPDPAAAAKSVSAAEPAEQSVQTDQPGFSRSSLVGMLIFGNLLTLILALVIGLGVLANLNDGALQFALPSDLPPLEQRISGLEASLRQLKDDQDAIRSRLDNLESLSDRVGAVERQNSQTQEDLKGQAAEIEILSSQAISLTNKISTVAESVTEIEGQVTELQTSSSRYQQFLDGLAQLLANILPEGK